ncbi:unnamed protein product, partial [Didymodactylos carnosus]
MNSQVRQRLQIDWNESMSTLDKIIDLLETLPSLSTQAFIDMDSDKNDLRSLLHESRLIIKELQMLHEALDTKELPNKTRKVYLWTSVQRHNTLCSNCHTVYHERCTLNEIPKQGDSQLAACAAFDASGTKCTKCPSKCSVKLHYHARKSVKPVDRSHTETLKAVEAEQSL